MFTTTSRGFAALAMTLVATLAVGACAPAAQPTPAAPTAAPAAKPTTPAAAAPTTAAAKPTTPAGAAPTTAPAAKPAAGTAPAAPAIAITGPVPDEAKSLNGAGATFPAVLYQKWFEEYLKLTQVQVNYQAIGSGGGIKGIQDKTVDFGGTDAPMTDDQLKAATGGEVFHIPTALGAVVATYNLPNVSGQLKFTGDTLAGIFLGDILKWNDPKLVAENPQLANINQDIVVVHRSDGSGTTFSWTDYLSTVSPDWNSKVGKGTAVNWPVGLGGSGNSGVAGEVKQNPYSIGYVELIYASQNGLSYGTVKNKSGQFIEPTLESVTAAAAGIADTVPPDLRFSIVDPPGATAYPISTATWLLAYKNQTEQPKALALSRVLWWATHEAQVFNKDLHFAVVPEGLTRISEQMILQINVDGKPALAPR